MKGDGARKGAVFATHMHRDAWRFTVRADELEIVADFNVGTYEARFGDARSASVHDGHLTLPSMPHAVREWEAGRSFAVAQQAAWPTFRQWLQIVWALGSAHWIMRRAPRDWVSWLRRKSSATVESEVQICRLVAVFHTAATLLPGLSRCLPRSMALLDFLARNGIRCHWLFAVRPIPFEAHCWVQWRDLVLTDHVDHVRWFTVFLDVE